MHAPASEREEMSASNSRAKPINSFPNRSRTDPSKFIGSATLFADLPVIYTHRRIYRVSVHARARVASRKSRGEKSSPVDCV